MRALLDRLNNRNFLVKSKLSPKQKYEVIESLLMNANLFSRGSQ
jgi:hypothetical protein